MFLFIGFLNSAIAEEMQGLSFIGHIQAGIIPKPGNDKNTLKKETDHVYIYPVMV